MKSVLIGAAFLLFLLFSCNQKKENNNTDVTAKPISTKITENDISKLNFTEFGLDIKAKKIVDSWESYSELESVVAKLKKGDLSFFKDNSEAITTFIKDFKKKIPDTINTLSIEARITTLETKLYKLESLNNLTTTSKDELEMSIKEFLESLSNLNLQINKKLEKDSRHIEKP